MNMKQRRLSDIDTIVVHCSDSPNDRDVTTDDIRRWHLQRGFADIGYHYVIRRDGTIEKGRADVYVGAHAKGYNTTSIGICLVGRDEFTDEQIYMLRGLCAAFSAGRELRVVMHHELNANKTCPNFSFETMLERFDTASTKAFTL